MIVSTGRSDQKARLNCSSISFLFYVIFQPFLHYPSVYIYRLTISTLGNKTKYFEILTLNNGEFNYPVIFLNLASSETSEKREHMAVADNER